MKSTRRVDAHTRSHAHGPAVIVIDPDTCRSAVPLLWLSYPDCNQTSVMTLFDMFSACVVKLRTHQAAIGRLGRGARARTGAGRGGAGRNINGRAAAIRR